jgi:hypothetical protein
MEEVFVHTGERNRVRRIALERLKKEEIDIDRVGRPVQYGGRERANRACLGMVAERSFFLGWSMPTTQELQRI